MLFYIDSANLADIKQAKKNHLLDGVTTNPSLIAKAGTDPQKLLKSICDTCAPLPVSVEVLSTDTQGMLREAERFCQMASNVVIKIPMTLPGMEAVRVLAHKGIKTNVTLVFNVLQALLAARAGATMVSPFVGRLDDTGTDGMQLVEEILLCYQNYALKTQVLVASVRHVGHLKQAALLGAHIATVPFKLMQSLAKHPLSDSGLERFLKDAKRFSKN